MNILFFSYEEPPQARLCDFGKFCNSSEAVDTRLAAWRFLPPELEKGKQNLYGQALDIWMLGLAMAYSWWPPTAQMQPQELVHHEWIQNFLWDEKQDGADLAHLIARMMAWDPCRRPSAEEALKHRSLRSVAESTAPIKTSSAKMVYNYDE